MNKEHHSVNNNLNLYGGLKGGAFSFDFASPPGEVTEAEKRAALKGASMRKLAGGRKRCKQGKSCGAACIFFRKDCVLELPVTVSRGVSQLRNYLYGEVKAGRLTADEAQEKFLTQTGLKKVNPNLDLRGSQARGVLQASVIKGEGNLRDRIKEMREQAKIIRSESTSKEEYRQKMRQLVSDLITHGSNARESGEKVISKEQQDAMKSPEKQAMFGRLQGVYERVSKGEITTQQQLDVALRTAIGNTPYTRTVSDAEVRFFLAGMPPTLRKTLEGWGEFNKGTNPDWGTETPGSRSLLTSGERMSKAAAARANAFINARMALETNFTDIATGLKINLADASLEHVIPRKSAGEMANIGANRFLMARGINSKKQDYSFNETFNPSSGFVFKGGKAAAAGGVSQKRQLIKDLESGVSSAKQALTVVGSLKPSDLDAKGRSQIMAAIVSRLTGLPQSATIGWTGRESAAMRASYQWFGGKESGWDSKASKEFGEKAAKSLARWAEQGPPGVQKIAQFTQAMDAVQKRLLGINQLTVPGSDLRVIDRQASVTGNANISNFIRGEITSVMNQSLPGLNAILDQD